MNANSDPLAPTEVSTLPWPESFGAAVDPLGLYVPLLHAQVAWALHPQAALQHYLQFTADANRVASHVWRRALGMTTEDPVTRQADDERFSDPAWDNDPAWDAVKEWYLLVTHRVEDMLYATPALEDGERRRAAFWWREWLNAMAPTNFFWTNPKALRLAAETKGDSLVSGLRNFADDYAAGDIRMTDPQDFRVGETLAVTPGHVIARNRLAEVIRYTPSQSRLYTVPIVIIPPWINKFYILDLTEKKSLIRFLRDAGFDVYVVSWKNPTPDMAGVSFDDYLTEGVDFAVQTARTQSGADNVHAVGYCIGGTALTAYMAAQNRASGGAPISVAHWTLLATLTDFSAPGDIEVFIDPGSVRYLSDAMTRRGVLDGKSMAAAFRLLRSNSLIWHYFVHGYLYGEKPSAFDVLFWNMDATRMPAAMHSWYLRELYLYNRLIERDALKLMGQPIDLEAIGQSLYAVGAEDDHIAPWRQTFRTVNHVKGPKRYVLSSSGHILGIINPVVTPPKRRFRADSAHRTDSAEKWLERTEFVQGSWWEDWLAWLRPLCGEMRDAPTAETIARNSLGEAPGNYVLES